jgi:hypothetical protein
MEHLAEELKTPDLASERSRKTWLGRFELLVQDFCVQALPHSRKHWKCFWVGNVIICVSFPITLSNLVKVGLVHRPVMLLIRSSCYRAALPPLIGQLLSLNECCERHNASMRDHFTRAIPGVAG